MLLFLIHSSVVQFHVREGERLLADLRARQAATARPDDPAIMQTARSAVGHLAQARQLAPRSVAKLEGQLGALHLFLNNEDAAATHLQRALELEPDFGAARYRWGELLARRGDLNAGIDQLIEALADDPALADARTNLLHAARRTQRLPETLPVLRRIAQRRPFDAAARIDYARALSELGRQGEAIAELEDLTQRRRRHAPAFAQLGRLQAQQRRWDAASAAFERAVTLAPETAAYRLLAAETAWQGNDQRAALRHLEAARQHHPDDPPVLRAWAAAQTLSGQLPQAIAAAEQAARQGPTAQYQLAFLYAAAGRTADANRAAAAAREANPDLQWP
jgi:tetratricopeptide (TPR) repeat protein